MNITLIGNFIINNPLLMSITATFGIIVLITSTYALISPKK